MLKGDWEHNMELQDQLLLNMQCAEQASIEFLELLGKLVDKKNVLKVLMKTALEILICFSKKYLKQQREHNMLPSRFIVN